MSEQTETVFLDVPGGKIFAKIWNPPGASQGAAILLLHDSLGAVEMWRQFPRLLCERTGRKVIAYDRLGFGQSSARKERPSLRFIPEETEIYLPPLIEGLGLERFALFGHSVGGAMAVSAAGFFGERCEAVITESAQAFVEERTRSGIRQAKLDFQNPGTFEKLKRYHGDKTKWVLDAWTEVWLSDEFADWSLKDALPKMKCPVMAIHGDKDEYGSVRFPEMICELAGGPAEKAVIAGYGHVPHREKEELVLDLAAHHFSRTKEGIFIP